MSEIHYFQRYSQKENVVTNNTLLLFSRLYAFSPVRLNALLSVLLNDTPLEIGVSFFQQMKSSKSIPDAEIVQPSIKILIETKLYSNYDRDQLENHIESFKNEDKRVLVLISPEVPPSVFIDGVEGVIREKNESDKSLIEFYCITFEKIIESCEDIIQDFEVELKELINDYREFCSSENLLPTAPYTMRAVTAGRSLEENIEHDIYYCPADRSYQPHEYMALYNNKAIVAVGKIKAISVVNYNGKKLIVKETTKELTDDEKQRIIDVIRKARENNGWDISNDHQFFLVEKFFKTLYKKDTKYPLQRTRYFDIKKILGNAKTPEAEKLAELLNDKTW